MPASVPCPTCRKPVLWGPQSPFRPFCSKRCRLIDLGDWFDERHRIAGEPDAPDAPNALTADDRAWPEPDAYRDPYREPDAGDRAMPH